MIHPSETHHSLLTNAGEFDFRKTLGIEVLGGSLRDLRGLGQDWVLREVSGKVFWA